MMELYLTLYDRYGVVRRKVISPLYARWSDVVNDDMPVVFGINENNQAVDLIEEFDIIQVMIRDKELGLVASDNGFVEAYIGIVRDIDTLTNEDGTTFFEYRCPGANHPLSWRRVAWYSGIDNRSTFSSVDAETVMKTCVQYNCTSDATVANGRQREGDLSTGMSVDITIAANQSRGDNVSLSFMGAVLLDALKKVSDLGGGDFALTWDGGTDWEFEFHEGQLGQDKSSGANRVLFSRQNASIRKPRRRRLGAVATVAISAGRDSGSSRQISIVEGDDYAADYDIELFVDARNEVTADGREARGEQQLDSRKAQSRATFEVLQTENQFYSPIDISGKKTYRAGDLVMLSYFGDEVKKIKAVNVEWKVPQSESPFTVSIDTEDV